MANIFLQSRKSLFFFFVLFGVNLNVRAQEINPQNRPYTVEYYYKAKWGYADEFIQLFRKNHFPVLNKLKDLGRIISVAAAKPVYHGTEDGRWDYRITITWRNIETTRDGFDEASLISQLYPDQDKFKKEEQHRFEILLAHWDLPVEPVDLNAK